MTVYWLCPDTDVPYGGVRKIYDWASTARRLGHDSAVLHARRPFRCTWFPSEAPVRWAEETVLTEQDLLMVPEILASTVHPLAEGVPKVVLVQNAYQVFGRDPELVAGPDSPYRCPDLRAVAVVSEDNARYMQLAFPDLDPPLRIHYAIDPHAHSPAQSKRRQIAYMPRKRSDEAAQVLAILSSRRVLEGWEVASIDGRSALDAAAELARSTVFLSFSQHEGWGLPPAEAMASGCIVIGYTGFAGSEFLEPDVSYPVPEGDVQAFARRVEEVLSAWSRGEEEVMLRGQRARERMLRRFPPEREAADLDALLSRSLAGVPPAPVSRRLTPDDLLHVVPGATKPRRGRRVLRSLAGLGRQHG